MSGRDCYAVLLMGSSGLHLFLCPSASPLLARARPPLSFRLNSPQCAWLVVFSVPRFLSGPRGLPLSFSMVAVTFQAKLKRLCRFGVIGKASTAEKVKALLQDYKMVPHKSRVLLEHMAEARTLLGTWGRQQGHKSNARRVKADTRVKQADLMEELSSHPRTPPPASRVRKGRGGDRKSLKALRSILKRPAQSDVQVEINESLPVPPDSPEELN